MHYLVEVERETDGRWIAEVPGLPGTLAYGVTRDEASTRAAALALHVVADRIQHGELKGLPSISFDTAAPAAE